MKTILGETMDLRFPVPFLPSVRILFGKISQFISFILLCEFLFFMIVYSVCILIYIEGSVYCKYTLMHSEVREASSSIALSLLFLDTISH